MDPEALFVVSTIKRSTIAFCLNAELEAQGLLDCRKPTVVSKIADDDERLTDEICTAYAIKLGDLDDDWSEEEKLEYTSALDQETLRTLGFVLPDPELDWD